jgi:hypothetical protein
VTTMPTDYSVINRFQSQRFEHGHWVRVGRLSRG